MKNLTLLRHSFLLDQEQGNYIFVTYGDCITIARPFRSPDFFYHIDQEQRRENQRVFESLDTTG